MTKEEVKQIKIASMRPRVFPAEDSTIVCALALLIACFNEAAGIPRGRRQLVVVEVEQLQAASMRPRVFPAED